jgi:effector-binding domain-containing protein
MTYDIATFKVPAEALVSIRERIAPSGISAFVGRSFDELYSHLRLLGVAPSGAPFVLYHEFDPAVIDMEACLPVAGEVVAKGRITSYVLPAATVARTLHVGAYDDLHIAHEALTRWVGQQGLEAAGPVRERYLNAPGEVPPSAYRTIIEMPVVPALVGAR